VRRTATELAFASEQNPAFANVLSKAKQLFRGDTMPRPPHTGPIDPGATEASKNRALDGLRGLAALAVFLAHYLISFYPYAFTRLYHGSRRPNSRSPPSIVFSRCPESGFFLTGTSRSLSSSS